MFNANISNLPFETVYCDSVVNENKKANYAKVKKYID